MEADATVSYIVVGSVWVVALVFLWPAMEGCRYEISEMTRSLGSLASTGDHVQLEQLCPQRDTT